MYLPFDNTFIISISMTEHLLNFFSKGSTLPTSGNLVPAKPGFFIKISLYRAFRFPKQNRREQNNYQVVSLIPTTINWGFSGAGRCTFQRCDWLNFISDSTNQQHIIWLLLAAYNWHQGAQNTLEPPANLVTRYKHKRTRISMFVLKLQQQTNCWAARFIWLQVI